MKRKITLTERGLLMAHDDFTETSVKEQHPASVGAATADLVKFREKSNELIAGIQNMSVIYDRILDNKTNLVRLSVVLNIGTTDEITFSDSANVEKIRGMFLTECAARILNYRKKLKELTEAFHQTL